MYVDNFFFSFPIPDFFLFLFNCNDGFQSWKAQNNIPRTSNVKHRKIGDGFKVQKAKWLVKKQVGKQKFSWKSIYDSHFLSAWVFLCVYVGFFFSLSFSFYFWRAFETVFFLALDLCIYHDYSCTLISFLDNESTREKKTHTQAPTTTIKSVDEVCDKKMFRPSL